MAEPNEDGVVILDNYGIINTGDAYRRELEQELAELEGAQIKYPSEYKQQRIDILKRRLQ